MKVTERDIRLLNWIGEQFIVNIRELEGVIQFDAQKHHLPSVGKHFTRDSIHRWKDAGLVQTSYQLRRGSHVFLTAQGIRATGLPFSPRTPAISDVAHLTHHDGVNRVRLHLEYEMWQAHYTMRWISERTLMQHQKQEAKTHPHAPKSHRPDGVVMVGEHIIAVEVEKTYKRPSKLKQILQEYLYSIQYTQTRYYCDTSAIQQSIQRGIDKLLSDLPSQQQTQLQDKVVALTFPHVT